MMMQIKWDEVGECKKYVGLCKIDYRNHDELWMKLSQEPVLMQSYMVDEFKSPEENLPRIWATPGSVL
jgi:hypothetical protein